MPELARPLIVALTGDYFLIPRLEDTAQALGFELEVVESTEDFGAEGSPVERKVQLTEPLEGPDAAFVRSIVDRRPALLIFDLTEGSIPWERWIQTLKTSSATRRIPIIAFGPHVETDGLERARAVGANAVVTRGRLQASMGSLIEEHARILDPAKILASCEGGLSKPAAEGLALLNGGDYYEAHELLEQAWMDAPEMEGYLYRTLLQVSVAYLQVERKNYAGAVKMLLRVRQWLEPLPASCRGIDVEKLKSNVDQFSAELHRLGPSGLELFDRALMRSIPLLSADYSE